MKCCLLLIGMLCSGMVFATEFGVVDELEGTAYLVDTDGRLMPVRLGQIVHTGQTIRTEVDSELHITSSDGGLIALRPDSVFRMEEYIAAHSPQDRVVLRLVKGGLRSVTGWIPKHHPESYQVQALTATIGIRGTDHEVHIIEAGQDEAGIHNLVHEGATVMRNAHGVLYLGAGEFGHAAHEATHKPRLLAHRPRFLNRLLLRIEHRLERRKAEMSHLLEGLRDAWLKRFGHHAS